MRLSCEVDVVNRLLPSHNVRKAKRGCHAQVSLGRKPAASASRSGSQLFLMVCTAKDRNGAKYVIKNNVSQVFAKFVSEGKATIRFKEPEQDLCLSKADPLQLKSLLSLVRAGAQGQDLDRVTLSSLAPASTKQVEKPRTELTVTSRKEYPVTSRFPASLEVLTVHSCGMKRLDPRILHLSRIHTLDLSLNALTSLPDDWGRLSCVSTLILTDNQLSEIPSALWKSQLCETIAVLDVRNNHIATIPLQICELHKLACLRLDNNGFDSLPPTIGKLTNLKELAVAQNKIKVLPAGFAQLRLENLDVSDNPFDLSVEGVTGEERLVFPTLMECVARAIRKYRIPYTEEDLFPQLFHYLAAARQCWCGNFCFTCSARYFSHVSLRHLVSNSYSASPGITTAPIEGFLCSQHCLTRFKNNPRAYWRN
ncbi:leucine-rich repeat protein 1-like [Haliotis cracherodii]|uniref:leucine-rich repeat protein 1-like n=1 Tax=Haliotis cracherodii TaxID=6455 RepID=UPI0039E8C2EB